MMVKRDAFQFGSKPFQVLHPACRPYLYTSVINWIGNRNKLKLTTVSQVSQLATNKHDPESNN